MAGALRDVIDFGVRSDVELQVNTTICDPIRERRMGRTVGRRDRRERGARVRRYMSQAYEAR